MLNIQQADRSAADLLLFNRQVVSDGIRWMDGLVCHTIQRSIQGYQQTQPRNSRRITTSVLQDNLAATWVLYNVF